MIVLSLIMTQTDYIFSLFTSKEVAVESQRIIDGLIPGFMFFIIFDSTRNLFNSIKKFEIPNLIVTFTYLLHIVWAYYFMVKLNLRMEGFGIARSVTEGLNAVLLILMVFLLKKSANKGD